ncbi:hypothetical protein PGB90_004817 [Kerria lacca]
MKSEESQTISNMSFMYGETCDSILKQYAEQTSNFTKCFIENARPITVCVNCATFYEKVRKSYENISKLRNDAGEMCKMKLIDVDRLEVIEGSFEYVINQWKKASCDKCFLNESTKLNNKTIVMYRRYRKITRCINHVNDTSHSNKEICKQCLNDYVNLNTIYDTEGSYNEFCMDIVDMMNTTRIKWSVNIGCCSERNKQYLQLVIVFSVICCLPLILYTSLYIKESSSNINQERWYHRLFRSTTSS